MDITKLIDHTLLKPEASETQIKKVCDEAKQYGFMSVCVNPARVEFTAKELAGSGICGIAVISAIYGQKEIRKASEELKAATEEILKEK